MSSIRIAFSLVGAGIMGVAGVMTASSASASTSQQIQQNISQQIITPQVLNQNPQDYIGKQVTLDGKIDRVLGNGSYIVSDSKSTDKSANRVLIFTSFHDSHSKMPKNQQAGTAASSLLKEGDSIKLSGRVEQFNVSSEVDSFSPKSDSESISETSESTPVVVIQPGAMRKN